MFDTIKANRNGINSSQTKISGNEPLTLIKSLASPAKSERPRQNEILSYQ